MPIAVDWLEQDKIIQAKITGIYTIEDSKVLNDKTQELLDTVPMHDIYLLVDVSTMNRIIVGFGNIFKKEYGRFLKADNLECLVACGTPKEVKVFVDVFVSMLNHITQRKIKVCDTYEEAIAFIHEDRA